MDGHTDFDSTEMGNGHTAAAVLDRAATPAVTIQRMPVKIRRVELDGDYAGWWADMHVNPPIDTILQMEGSALNLFEQLPKLIRAWNFGDPEGQPLPLTPEGLRALPDDLLKQLTEGYQAARGLPKATSVS